LQRHRNSGKGRGTEERVGEGANWEPGVGTGEHLSDRGGIKKSEYAAATGVYVTATREKGGRSVQRKPTGPFKI